MTAWEPFDKLRESINEALAPLGVSLEHWAIMPEQKAAQMIIAIRPEAFKTPEQLETDKQFEDIMAMDAHFKAQEKAESARERAKQLAADLASGKAFELTPEPDDDDFDVEAGCPTCGRVLGMSDDEFVCDNCGFRCGPVPE